MRRSPSFIAVILLLLCFSCSSEAGLKIYYIRHIECGHNVEKYWKDVPKDQWPPYVGNQNMATPKGEEQAASVPKKLSKYPIDFIAVSPMWRTRYTILPYLKEHQLKGEIWPELHECPPAKELAFPNLPKPSPIFNAGDEITLPPEQAPYFTFREDGKREYRVNYQEPQYSADMQAVLHSILDRIMKGFGGTEKSVLLVGHGSQGTMFLKMLLGDPSMKLGGYMQNIGVWMVEQQPDGHFKLEMYNDKRVGKSEMKAD